MSKGTALHVLLEGVGAVGAQTGGCEGEACSRNKFWLDDMMSALNGVYAHVVCTITSECGCGDDEATECADCVMRVRDAKKVKATLVSFALEFYFQSNIVINTVKFADWSLLRPELRNLVMVTYSQHAQPKRSLDNGSTTLGIQVASDSPHSDSPDSLCELEGATDGVDIASLLVKAVEAAERVGTEAETRVSTVTDASLMAAVADPIRTFIQHCTMPVRMQRPYTDFLNSSFQKITVSACPDGPLSALELLVSTLADSLEQVFPFQWRSATKAILNAVHASTGLPGYAHPSLFHNMESFYRFVQTPTTYFMRAINELVGEDGPRQMTELRSLAKSELGVENCLFDGFIDDKVRWSNTWKFLLSGVLSGDAFAELCKNVNAKYIAASAAPDKPPATASAVAPGPAETQEHKSQLADLANAKVGLSVDKLYESCDAQFLKLLKTSKSKHADENGMVAQAHGILALPMDVSAVSTFFLQSLCNRIEGALLKKSSDSSAAVKFGMHYLDAARAILHSLFFSGRRSEASNSQFGQNFHCKWTQVDRGMVDYG